MASARSSPFSMYAALLELQPCSSSTVGCSVKLPCCVAGSGVSVRISSRGWQGAMLAKTPSPLSKSSACMLTTEPLNTHKKLSLTHTKLSRNNIVLRIAHNRAVTHVQPSHAIPGSHASSTRDQRPWLGHQGIQFALSAGKYRCPASKFCVLGGCATSPTTGYRYLADHHEAAVLVNQASLQWLQRPHEPHVAIFRTWVVAQCTQRSHRRSSPAAAEAVWSATQLSHHRCLVANGLLLRGHGTYVS